MDLEEFNNKLHNLDVDLLKLEVLDEESNTILALNKEQMSRGENYKGQKITPKYKSPYYARKKNRLNPAPGLGTPDIEVSTNLKDEMDIVTPTKKIYNIVSFVGYVKYVIPRYDGVFGLQQKNLNKVQVTNTAKLHQKIKRDLGL
jgi:hypothetical protein